MISLDWTLGLQFVSFMFLLFVLNRILYRPLQKIMAQRRERIDGSLSKASELERSIEEKMAIYQRQLDSAKKTATEERQLIRKAAAAEEAGILAQANEKASSELHKIKQQVADEAEKAGKALESEAQKLATEIATKVLGRELA